jgi:hypothetical protein
MAAASPLGAAAGAGAAFLGSGRLTSLPFEGKDCSEGHVTVASNQGKVAARRPVAQACSYSGKQSMHGRQGTELLVLSLYHSVSQSLYSLTHLKGMKSMPIMNGRSTSGTRTPSAVW